MQVELLLARMELSGHRTLDPDAPVRMSSAVVFG